MNKIQGDSLANGSVGANKIKVNELYVGAGGIRLDSSAVISWGQVSSKPFIPQNASDVGARPDTWTPNASDVGALPVGTYIPDNNAITTISRNEISTAKISANQITGGTITGVTINVGTNATIGKQLILSVSDFNAGIKWGTAPESQSQSIYIDPTGGGLFIYNPKGGIYAGNQRIDTAPVAVFG